MTNEPEEVPDEIENEFDITEKELELLDLLYTRDMDAESAMVQLHIKQDEFNRLVKRLLQNELLQYTSFNVIELTEVGISYVSNKNKKDTEQKVPEEEIKIN